MDKECLGLAVNKAPSRGRAVTRGCISRRTTELAGCSRCRLPASTVLLHDAAHGRRASQLRAAIPASSPGGLHVCPLPARARRASVLFFRAVDFIGSLRSEGGGGGGIDPVFEYPTTRSPGGRPQSSGAVSIESVTVEVAGLVRAVASFPGANALLTSGFVLYKVQYIMASTKKLYSFLMEPEQAAGLKAIRERDGVPTSEQIRRAIDAWLREQRMEPASRRVQPRRKASTVNLGKQVG